MYEDFAPLNRVKGLIFEKLLNLATSILYKEFVKVIMNRLIKKYMIKHSFVLIIFVCCLLSCRQNKDVVFADFDSTTDLIAMDSINIADLDILNPYYIHYKDSFLIFSDKEKTLYFCNLCDNKVVVRQVIGQGAGEMVNYSIMNTTNPISYRFVDYHKKRVYEMNLANLRKDSTTRHLLVCELPSGDTDYLLRLYETNHFYFGIGMFQDGRIYCYNKQTGQYKVNMDFPSNDEIKQIGQMHKGALFASTLMTGNDTTLVTSCFGLLDYYTVLPDGTLRLKSARHYFFPQFIWQKTGKLIAFKRNTVQGFCGIDTDGEFVYLLYSGKSVEESGLTAAYSGSHLLVYDWNGLPVVHYRLSKSLVGFSIGNGILYGLSREKEPVVYTFQLNSL